MVKSVFFDKVKLKEIIFVKVVPKKRQNSNRELDFLI